MTRMHGSPKRMDLIGPATQPAVATVAALPWRLVILSVIPPAVTPPVRNALAGRPR
jgi:hypothetical protein